MKNYMNWVDHLFEVGTPIRRERDKLAGMLAKAQALEIEAAGLRAAARTGRAALVANIEQRWTPAEITAAHRNAAREAPPSLDAVRDPQLRAQLRGLDGEASPVDLLQIFSSLLRQHNLLSTATDAERRETLERVLDWHNHGLRPWREAVRPGDAQV